MILLQELYLNENKITDISALVNLPNLRKLDLNTNKIVSIANKPSLPSLTHLDLGNNGIKDADELLNLSNYKNLAVLIMTGCPYAEEVGEKLKNEVLISLGQQLKHIKTVNEEEVTEDDITAATEERNERIKAKREAEEEAARLAAEKAAEEAAAAANKTEAVEE
jgi:hypothetical protein